MTNWDEELQKAADQALKLAAAVIRKDGPSSKPYCIYSKGGKKLGCYSSKKKAQDRLTQIEQFKHIKGESDD